MAQYLLQRSVHVSELGGLLLADSQSMDVIEENDRGGIGRGCLWVLATEEGTTVWKHNSSLMQHSQLMNLSNTVLKEMQ